jgi:N-acetylmuramoyl-L-alanine amidase
LATNSPIHNLVVHCSASKPKLFVDASVIDRWHRERGFLKIGYHYVILRDGTVQKGRKDSEVGAHVEGYNTGSLGICLVGGLNDSTGKSENNFTKEQFASLSALLFKLSLEHPGATVLGHRDFPNVHKDCPCFDTKEWWAKEQEK